MLSSEIMCTKLYAYSNPILKRVCKDKNKDINDGGL